MNKILMERMSVLLNRTEVAEKRGHIICDIVPFSFED